jgi:hypothetical protein
MALDRQKFEAFMSWFVPLVIKNQMQLDEYKAYEESQARQTQERLRAALEEQKGSGEQQRQTIEDQVRAKLIEAFANPEFRKGRPAPELDLLDSLLKYVAPKYTTGFNFPVNLGEQVAEANKAATQLATGLQTSTPVPEEIMPIITSRMGWPALQEVIQQTQKAKTGEEQRKLTREQLAEAEKRRQTEEKKVAIEQQKIVEFKKGKLPEDLKEARKRLASLADDRRRYEQKLSGVGELGEKLSPEQISQAKIVVNDIRAEENRIDKKFGKDIIADYKTVVEGLKKQGFIESDLDTDERLIKNLTLQGYDIGKLKLYW